MALNRDQEFLAKHADYCFRRATCSMQGAEERWNDRAARPMSDAEVKHALEYELGEMGGGCAPDEPDYEYQRSGLKIWGGWSVRRSSDKPLWQGAATIAKARAFYGLRQPSDDRQLSLFGA